MNNVLFIAGSLSILIGLIHSILGELLIFRKFRFNSIIPTVAKPPLSESNVRILWATWHITSFFGGAIGAVLLYISTSMQAEIQTIIYFSSTAMCASGVLVLVATKAKHPGWAGLLIVACLCLVG